MVDCKSIKRDQDGSVVSVTMEWRFSQVEMAALKDWWAQPDVVEGDSND